MAPQMADWAETSRIVRDALHTKNQFLMQTYSIRVRDISQAKILPNSVFMENFMRNTHLGVTAEQG